MKGANSFALYELALPASTGVFSTLGLLTSNGNNQPDVSHVSFWVLKNPPSNDIPEPASLALIGVGSLAAAALRRRSRKF